MYFYFEVPWSLATHVSSSCVCLSFSNSPAGGWWRWSHHRGTAWSRPWPHSWQKWQVEWKYQRAWGLQLRLQQAQRHNKGSTHSHENTHTHICITLEKDISTLRVPVLPCGWGCWGWGSRGLGGLWGQTCSPASPSWPPLPFSWPSQSTPGCLIFLHRPQGGHLLKDKQTIIIFLCVCSILTVRTCSVCCSGGCLYCHSITTCHYFTAYSSSHLIT